VKIKTKNKRRKTRRAEKRKEGRPSWDKWGKKTFDNITQYSQ